MVRLLKTGSDERRDGILNNGAQITLPENPDVGIPILGALKTRGGDRTIFLMALKTVAITEAPLSARSAWQLCSLGVFFGLPENSKKAVCKDGPSNLYFDSFGYGKRVFQPNAKVSYGAIHLYMP